MRVFLLVTRRAKRAIPLSRVFYLCMLLLLSSAMWAQVVPPPAVAPEPKPEVPKDALGRDTPRGAVLGFLAAARKNSAQVAYLYLNTPLRGENAEELARQLAVVLNRRLPARLNEISDKPEGSLPDPLKPDEDLVGTITTEQGELDIRVERVDRGKGKVWLFSQKTLQSIPAAYGEISTPPIEKLLPAFLVKRIGNIPLFQWLAIFVGMPFLYLLTGLLDRLLVFGLGRLRRRLQPGKEIKNLRILLPPFRLLLLAVAIRWLLTRVGLPLLARQFWASVALIVAICACTWLLILANGRAERYLVARYPSMSESAAVVRLFRRIIDGLILFAGLLFTLYHFGFNPTAALAGLGVGGIAVALAAQKTLENLIAGISLVADQAIHVGDFLKVGDLVGTVEDVGLRSTRIRTLDRTLLCVPNGQISSVTLETFSVRDKFWFHPIVALRFETTSNQMRSVINKTRNLLLAHPRLESSSVRVRFVGIGASSFNVEIFAYVFAFDWNHFLEIQEQLLLSVIETIEQSGTEIAFPSQTTYLTTAPSGKLGQVLAGIREKNDSEQLQPENSLHR